ncbi:hypothetical protein HPB48_010264 [Haemaphysalis longicornis]|uniref:Low-density lipoprotein receptor n=1 Tax=Haemaphysalis longicornis TaxID=44386 RepID=A0A9J6FN98_HAELO|nr:hypothetical protein HPB48_010264 [Haemaphysalis longicornis]
MNCSSSSLRFLGMTVVLALVIHAASASALLGTVSARNSCSSDQFECVTSNECIPTARRCNGDRDCTDGSDENAVMCQNSTTNCSPKTFFCPLLNDFGICAPASWLCDGKSDCLGGLDERNCGNLTCTEDQFACKNGSCIQRNWICDGEVECADGSDEVPAVCPKDTSNCPLKKFACQLRDDFGICAPVSWLCNRKEDCLGGSDERNCGNRTCTEGEFACRTGNCIPRNWTCDGYRDCADYSDEVSSTCAN